MRNNVEARITDFSFNGSKWQSCAFYCIELELHSEFLRLNALYRTQLQLYPVCVHLAYGKSRSNTDPWIVKMQRHTCRVYFINIKWLGLLYVCAPCARFYPVRFSLILSRPFLWPLTGSIRRRWIVHRTNSWGYLKNGTFDGMIGALVRKEIDVGGSPIFFRSERAKVIDYTARTWISRWVNCKSTKKKY